MKKRTVKKLVLAKETVMSLEDVALGAVAGGSVGPWENCNTEYNSCRVMCQDGEASYYC